MRMNVRSSQGGSYHTEGNGDYGIVTLKLKEGDWIATTREFTASGDTESAAIAALGKLMSDAAASLTALAKRLQQPENQGEEAVIE